MGAYLDWNQKIFHFLHRGVVFDVVFCHNRWLAEVAELVDALDSKSSGRNIVRVRFPPSAPPV